MDQITKDWLQAAGWLAGAAGLILAAVKFWSELRAARAQRERELRWRQAEAGKSLNDEMQTDDRAWPAMQMLDSPSRTYELREGHWVTITRDDVVAAFALHAQTDSEKVVFIRDCFDTLFYFFAMFDHYISSSLIVPADVAYPVEYYVPLMAEMHSQITSYFQRYNLHRARRFLERYPAWKEVTVA